MMPLILAACLAFCAAGPNAARDDSTTVGFSPWMEILQSPAQPASLFSLPSGAGRAFAQAVAWGGERIDATLVTVLWSDQPGWGDPVPYFPAEDMWLTSANARLVPCNGGTIADADTDAAGRTTWAAPLQAGGQCDPDSGDRLLVVVNGDVAADLTGLGLRVNSADLDGNGVVNLSDVGRFVSDLFGDYAYRSDFSWDGVINLADAGFMSQGLGAQCP